MTGDFKEHLLDRLIIQDVLARYCRAVDRGWKEDIDDCFFDDAWDDHGVHSVPAREFIAALVPRMDAYPLPAQHHVTNVLIDFRTAEKAHVETYFLCQNPSVDEGGAWSLIHLGGRYFDVFERREGEWKISSRKVAIDWSINPNGEPWELQARFAAPGRREGDAGYQFFHET